MKIMKEYVQLLSQNEKVLWEGKPVFFPYFVKSFAVVPFGALFFGFILVWMVQMSETFGLFALIGMSFALTGLGVALSPLYCLLVYSNLWYVITDKRVIFQMGIVGRDFKVIDFDKIQSMGVEVGFIDKLFGQNSGSIAIDTGRLTTFKDNSYPNPYILISVSNPYKVFEFLKKVSHDVKTDMEYPNALRPETNSGYKTEYKTKKEV